MSARQRGSFAAGFLWGFLAALVIAHYGITGGWLTP